MSAWGTGIRQSDEFADVYEEFFDLYRDDASAMDIYRKILAEYRNEFADEAASPMLYTAYYALALCLWECGERDEWLWAKIGEIIASDADIKFWNEFGIDPDAAKSRRRNLKLFWEKLQTTPARIRKPAKSHKKRGPTLHKGDVFAYAVENGYRAAVVFDYVWDSFLIGITEDVFSDPPTEEDVMRSYTKTVAWFPVRAVIPKKDRLLISDLQISGNYNNRAGLLLTDRIAGCSSIGEREFFFDPETAAPCMERNHIGRYTMRELTDPEILPKYNEKVRTEWL